jgi:hypothetical protein
MTVTGPRGEEPVVMVAVVPLSFGDHGEAVVGHMSWPPGAVVHGEARTWTVGVGCCCV